MYQTPVPHVIIDQFLPNAHEVLELANRLYEDANNGLHGGQVYDGLVRREIYLHAASEKNSILAEHLRQEFIRCFWAEDMKSMFSSLPQPFPMLNATTSDSMLVGYYNTGDKYSLHEDYGLITAVYYLQFDGAFDGGELALTNQLNSNNFNLERTTLIEAKHNRLVLFPSCYRHGVKPVSSLTGPRIALTYLTALTGLFGGN